MLYTKAESAKYRKDTNIMNLKDKTMSNDSTKTSDTVEKHFFRASAADFKKIPGSPIAYWVSEQVRAAFISGKILSDIAEPRKGITTADNDKYLRLWYEIEQRNFDVSVKAIAGVVESEKKWFPVNKGGVYRKWYGNKEVVIDWFDNGKKLKAFENAVIRNSVYYFREGMTWNDISSGKFAMRYSSGDAMFEGKGPMAFAPKKHELNNLIAFFNSVVSASMLSFLCPTLNFNIGEISKTPIVDELLTLTIPAKNSINCICTSKYDWDGFETSWDFTELPLINSQTVGRVSDSSCASEGIIRQIDDIELLDQTTNSTYPLTFSIKQAYTQLRAHWQAMTMGMQRLEQENNRIFIDAYGLQDELTPDVPLNEITLTCNPHYRYGNNKTDAELEALLLADTLKEFISYAVGCMFGRYALDKPGLILANQGETLADYLKQIPEPIFSVDDDNVIPMLDGDWFTDDVTERFGKFLKVTFGEAHYEENLKYIEQALGKDIRKYFLKDFYNDHLKRYKKRPIYWLFSSPKGTFNALIYLHRYRSDTVSVVLNDYLREFRAKLSAHKIHLEAVSISGSASASEKTKALKDIENHRKMLDELDTYEREVLYPLATEQLEIDLDDGVKVNYQKFGEALKKIPGLAAKED